MYTISLLLSLIVSSTLSAITLNANYSNNSLIVYNSNMGLVHETRELKLSPNEKQIVYEDEANLSGWITINNRSGKSFKNTSLHVLAGDVNRAKQPRRHYTT